MSKQLLTPSRSRHDRTALDGLASMRKEQTKKLQVKVLIEVKRIKFSGIVWCFSVYIGLRLRVLFLLYKSVTEAPTSSRRTTRFCSRLARFSVPWLLF